MIKEEYTVNIGNLKISGPVEDIHNLAHIYALAACRYHQVIDENRGELCDSAIAALEAKQKEAKSIEERIIDTISDSDYYQEYLSEMSALMAEIS